MNLARESTHQYQSIGGQTQIDFLPLKATFPKFMKSFTIFFLTKHFKG